MQQALDGSTMLKARAAKAGVAGNREYNTGWHTALDLDNLLTVSEIVARAGARAQGEPRRAFPRRLIRRRARSGASATCASPKRPTERRASKRPRSWPMTDEMKQVIEENK